LIRPVPVEESSRGYVRDELLQKEFDTAAQTLLDNDGCNDPERGGENGLVADLALEGGGVKGIGLVGAVLVLDEAGYRYQGVAGTSASAIAASLIAGLSQSDVPMTNLLSYMNSLEFANFMPEGKLHRLLDHVGGHAGDLVADAAILSRQMGIYNGDYLRSWLGPILHDELKVRTFADLKLTTQDDPDLSLPAGHEYRLVVNTSDITRAQLVRLPWDFPLYGRVPVDNEDPVEAVRASMSIPFFFEPVTFEATKATVSIPTPSGGSTELTYGGGTVTWVDGGLLQNFPIHAFDRDDGAKPRWPTIGIKLSRQQRSFPATEGCQSALAVGVRCLRTMMNEWDTYAIDEQTAARTIFVDNAGLSATDFNLTKQDQDRLFINGVTAATEFVIAMARAGGVPRTSDASKNLVNKRRALGGVAPSL